MRERRDLCGANLAGQIEGGVGTKKKSCSTLGPKETSDFQERAKGSTCHVQ